MQREQDDLDARIPAAGGSPLTPSRPLAAALFVGALALYVGLLGFRPLVTPDEFRYAEVPREMVATGDWIVPRLDGLAYFEKPVLGYWLTAASILAFGENAFAVRLPFGFATLLTAAIVYGLVRRLAKEPATALFAASIYLTCGLVAGVGTFAVLDSLLALWLTAALASFFVATEHPPGPRRYAWLAACGGACGAAFLTKGFLAFAVAAIVAGPYLIWTRRFRELFTLPWIPMLVTAVVAAPWCVAVGRADPDFWRYFFWVEHIQRFSGGEGAQHSDPFWVYVPVVLAGALPWTFLAIPALARWRHLRPRPLVRYAACWFVFPFAFFSMASGKLPTYVLPCFAPLSILVAAGAASMPIDRLLAHLERLAVGLGVALGVVGVGALVQTVTNVLRLESLYTPAEDWKGYAGAAACVIAAGVAVLGSRSPQASGRTAGIVSAVFVVMAAGAFVFPEWHGSKTPQRWIEAQTALIPDDAILITDARLVHAVCWCLRRSDATVLGSPGELGYGLLRPEQQRRNVEATDLAAMIEDPARTRPIVILARAVTLGPTELPVAGVEDEWRGMVLLKYDAPG